MRQFSDGGPLCNRRRVEPRIGFLTDHARPLIDGEFRVPIEGGLPRYAVLEKVRVEKKLPARG